jgi:hypothetical protein
MDDLIGKAHAYLDDKGCKSMGQKYTAFEIERMLADFAQQQLNLLNIPVVVGQSEQLLAFLEWIDQSPEENAGRSREDLVKDYLSQ